MKPLFPVSKTLRVFPAIPFLAGMLAFTQEAFAASLDVRAVSSLGDELVLSFPTIPFAGTEAFQGALVCASQDDGNLALTSARLWMEHDGAGHGGPRVVLVPVSTRCTRISRVIFPHSGDWSVKVELESGAKAEFSFAVAPTRPDNVRIATASAGTTVAITFPSPSVSSSTTTATVCVDSDRAIEEVAPWMPDMGHGTSPTRVTRLSPTCHAVEDLDLFMPGPWEFRVRLASGETVAVPVNVAP